VPEAFFGFSVTFLSLFAATFVVRGFSLNDFERWES
jgi:hypothetical protein